MKHLSAFLFSLVLYLPLKAQLAVKVDTTDSEVKTAVDCSPCSPFLHELIEVYLSRI